MRRCLLLLLCLLPLCLRVAGAQSPEPPKIATQALIVPERPGTLSGDALARVREMLERRARALGDNAAEFSAAEGGLRVRLRGRHAQRRLELLTRTGMLEFRWLKKVRTARNNRAPYLLQIVETQDRSRYAFQDARSGASVPLDRVLKESPLVLDRHDLRPDSALDVTSGAFLVVRVELTEEGTRKIRRFAREHVPTLLGVYLDSEFLASIPVTDRISKDVKNAEGYITGGYRDEVEARLLAAVINTGPLPVPVKVQDARYVPVE
ncbi:MAG: hypothetical protein HY320_03465 [Armatimonadetes bacterium]|nr:hypothetical protein [Armatimonadota bacterium]